MTDVRWVVLRDASGDGVGRRRSVMEVSAHTPPRSTWHRAPSPRVAAPRRDYVAPRPGKCDWAAELCGPGTCRSISFSRSAALARACCVLQPGDDPVGWPSGAAEVIVRRRAKVSRERAVRFG
jgi:hypothetical protein